MISTLLVDDEPVALAHLSSIISKSCPELQISGSATYINEALDLIEKLSPELVLLDIELAGQNSFELLEQDTGRNFEIIFVTAHNEFAIRAIKHGALDYILKPINTSELVRAVEKASLRIYKKKAETNDEDQVKNSARGNHGRLALSTLEGLIFVDLDKIIFCESDGRYTRFYLAGKDRTILVSKNLGEFEAILPPEDFARIHHHTIVNLKYIEKYVKGRGGYVVLTSGQSLMVSSRKKDDFFSKLQ